MTNPMQKRPDGRFQKTEPRPLRLCLEGDLHGLSFSGRLSRECGLAARGTEIALAVKTRRTYGHWADMEMPGFFQKLLKRPPGAAFEVLFLPAFAAAAIKPRPQDRLFAGFDPINPNPLELVGLKNFSHILVPTERHARCCLDNDIPAKRVRVQTIPVNRRTFHPRAHADPLAALPDEFRFLVVANPLWRKGLDIILKAYLEEFSPQENVRLVLKLTQMPKLKKHFPYEIGDLAKRLGALNAMFPAVTVLADPLPDRELAGLMAHCDVLVNANRSFHSGLSVLEGMACGLGIIGPDVLAELYPTLGEVGSLFPTDRVLVAADALFPGSQAGFIHEPVAGQLRTKMREACSRSRWMRKQGLTGQRWEKTRGEWKQLVRNLVADLLPPGSGT